jgi:hypothetical protein
MYPERRKPRSKLSSTGDHFVWDVIHQAITSVAKLRRYIRRSTLHVYFDAAVTYQIREVAGGASGYFCHVMVRNNGSTTARNCRGRLLEVSMRHPDGSTSPAPGFVAPVFLKWAGQRDFDPQDVERDQPRRLDLCFALASSPDQLRFFAPPSPSGVLIFPRGVYTVRVRVSVDNMRAAHAVFRVDFTRGWDDIVVVEGA